MNRLIRADQKKARVITIMQKSGIEAKRSVAASNQSMISKQKSNAAVAIVAPSLKLLDKMRDAAVALDSFGIAYNLAVVAAHRAPNKTIKFASELESEKVEVIVAGGTGSAHLPGMLASLTTLPVIGVPIKGESLDGIDSLYSMLQMPKGIPVATIGIDSAYNAGILACQILCLKHPELKTKLVKHREALEQEVEAEDAKLRIDQK
ncbi:MAG TPA: 5-(carboxyamino)imidazole ribonucleotide mutase [Nitrososphaera sp.]|nr:5-(carboxyamino)imidazole ribonucleotide mutase [Nitrososphaera sp.]